MHIAVSQVYVSPDASFSFSWRFQVCIAKRLTQLIKCSDLFATRYSRRYTLGFYFSAKRGLRDNEIHGPSVSKRYKCVEYTIFVPFDLAQESQCPNETALAYFIDGVVSVLDSLEIVTDELRSIRGSLVKELCGDKEMFD